MITLPMLRPVNTDVRDKSWFKRVVAWVTSVREWEVMVDWAYTLPNGTIITIPAGFVFDGASVPKIFWGLLSPTGLLFIPGIVHDFSYKNNYLILGTYDSKNGARYTPRGDSRLFWDNLFRTIDSKENGLKAIGTTAYYAIRMFGWISWGKHRKNDEK